MSEPEIRRLSLPGPAATDRLGARLLPWLREYAASAPDGALVTLDGPLGAGKSALVRALLRAAGVTGPVPSPTFTLVEPYTTGAGQFFHLDLYRLGEPDELILLGYEEMRRPGSTVLIEWASRAGPLTANPALAVTLAYDGAGRTAELRFAQGPVPALD